MQSLMRKVPPLLIVIASVCGCATALGKSDKFAAAEKLLDEQQWQAAQTEFSALSNAKDERQDAALYWLAYAQFKAKQSQAALKTLQALQKRHPQSRWLDDAKALRIEIKDKDGDIGEIEDDELKLYAINALMNRPSDKAVSLLANIIQGDVSRKLAKRALFVLSQMNKPEAFELIRTTATDDTKPVQQLEAIKVLGLSHSKKAVEVLQDIYKSSNNEEVRYRILKSFMVANAKTALLNVARTEQNDKLKTKAIKLLGHISAGEDLMVLYREPNFAKQRATIIKSIGNSGDTQTLQKIINTESDSKLKVLAIKRLGMTSAGRSGDLITRIYQQSTDDEVKAASIHALFLQSNAKALIAIIKQETNPKLKRRALKKLTLIDSDEAIDYFTEILGAKG